MTSKKQRKTLWRGSILQALKRMEKSPETHWKHYVFTRIYFGRKCHHRNRINDIIGRAWIYHSTLFIYAKRNKQNAAVWAFSQSLYIENPRISKN